LCSAALIKAALINSATNLSGQYRPTESGAIPNVGEGFGRVDLFAAVSETESQVFQTWDEGTALDTGEEQTFDVTLPKHASSFKATLVWTDPAGETLQNDLDLTVRTAKGTERHGNMRANAKGFDRRNNVEQVTMSNVAAGKITITVRAFRIALHPQNFALIVRATD
jgi:serine protease AprX